MGWLVIAFDLPVVAPEQRKAAVRFRDSLLDDGFEMIQYSVYARPCVSFARQETHIRRVRVFTPPKAISALFLSPVPSGIGVMLLMVHQQNWVRPRNSQNKYNSGNCLTPRLSRIKCELVSAT